jgi:DNA polymerase III subunit epsilon
VIWPSPPWDSVVYWTLDLETGGLDPRKDALLAVGMVPVRAGVITLRDAWQSLVRPEAGAVSLASIRAHQLVPADVAAAPPLGDVIAEVDRRAREGVLLVHNARIDVGFLRRAFERCDRSWPRPRVVDTVDLLVRLLRKQRFLDPAVGEKQPVLNLSAARRGLGLPDYQAHDALNDAVATAELFLVLRRRLGARRLRDLR